MKPFLKACSMLLAFIGVLTLAAGPASMPKEIPQFTPEQAKTLNDWSYGLALDAATLGWPSRHHVHTALQRRGGAEGQGGAEQPVANGKHHDPINRRAGGVRAAQ
jgi:hypothetical protein